MFSAFIAHVIVPMAEDKGDEQHYQWNLSWVVERVQVVFDDLFPVNLFERLLTAVQGI